VGEKKSQKVSPGLRADRIAVQKVSPGLRADRIAVQKVSPELRADRTVLFFMVYSKMSFLHSIRKASLGRTEQSGHILHSVGMHPNNHQLVLNSHASSVTNKVAFLRNAGKRTGNSFYRAIHS
jgi:hypothetical protein